MTSTSDRRPPASLPEPGSTAGAGALAPGRVSPRALVPVGLALVAEAAWITVVAGVLQTAVLRDTVIGIVGFTVFAIAGVVVARLAGPRLGVRWPWVAVAVAVAGGAVGWLVSPDARAILLAGGPGAPGRALGMHPGGWLAAVALVRGYAYASLRPDPRRTGSVLWLGIPGLTVAALVGGMLAEPWRSRFLTEAEATVIVFLVAGVLALALARVSTAARGMEVDWRANPAWVLLLAALLMAMAGFAIAATVFAVPVLVAVAEALVAPVLLIGLVAGFDRRAARILLVSLCLALVLATVLNLLQRLGGPGGAGAAPAPAIAPPDAPTSPHVLVATAAIGVLLAVIALVVLVRLWMRGTRPPEDEVPETRVIDRGGDPDDPTRRRRPWRALAGRRPEPADAAAAYQRLIEELRQWPPVRRNPEETPRQHARRLRGAGLGGLELDMLAADYGLARFAGRRLSAAEERRALTRRLSLRQRLGEACRAMAKAELAATRGRRTRGVRPDSGPEPVEEATRPGAPSIGRTG